MDYREWLIRTRYMNYDERSRSFDSMSDSEQISLMDSFARSAKLTKRGNVKNFFKG